MKVIRYYRVLEKSTRFIEVYNLDNRELFFNCGEEYGDQNIFNISLSHDDVKSLINDLKNLINDEG